MVDGEDDSIEAVIRERWDRLVKPPGSLGDLESWAARVGSVQEEAPPRVRPASLLLFAGDHGVTGEDVSAYPAEVTARMLETIADGAAASSALARWAEVDLRWYNVGVQSDRQRRDEKVAGGTANFTGAPAMEPGQRDAAVACGQRAVRRADERGDRLLCLGEMGIGNTTTSAALVAALLDRPPEESVGPGTGVDAEGRRHKARVVRRALEHHAGELDDPDEVLRRLGGLEIAALTGAIQEAVDRRIPVVLDGYVTASAALVAARRRPEVTEGMLAAHRSREPAHGAVLEALGLEPMFDFDLQLGEGTGALVAASLLEAAASAYREMATLEEAGIA